MTFSKLKVPFIIVLDQNQNLIIRCDKQFGCESTSKERKFPILHSKFEYAKNFALKLEEISKQVFQ